MSFSGFFPTWCVQRGGGQQGDGRAEQALVPLSLLPPSPSLGTQKEIFPAPS